MLIKYVFHQLKVLVCSDLDLIRIRLVSRLQIWNKEASKTLKKWLKDWNWKLLLDSIIWIRITETLVSFSSY